MSGENSCVGKGGEVGNVEEGESLSGTDVQSLFHRWAEQRHQKNFIGGRNNVPKVYFIGGRWNNVTKIYRSLREEELLPGSRVVIHYCAGTTLPKFILCRRNNVRSSCRGENYIIKFYL